MRLAVILLHISLPVVMGPALALNLLVATGAEWWWPGVLALLLGSAAVYSGERALVRSSRFAPSEARVLITVCGLALIGLAVVVLRYQDRLLAPVAYLGLLAVAYPALVRIRGCKVVVVAAAWWLGCSLLPVVAGMTPWYLLADPVSWGIALLVASGTMLCDIKDAEADQLTGVPSLPVLIGSDQTRYLAAAVAASVAIPTWNAAAWGLLVPAFLLVILAFRPGLLHRPLWGPIAVDASLVLAAIVPLVRLMA